MDLAARLQQLEDMIKEAKSMPLSSSALLNREELLELVAGMRESLPEEIKQARWVVRDREELLAKARRESESLVEKARTEQAKLVEREQVVQAAQEESDRVAAQAREQAQQIRNEAEDYVDGKLAQFEITIQRTQEALAQTHDTLADGLDKTKVALGDSLQRTHGYLEKVNEQVTKGRDKLSGTGHPAQELIPEDEEPLLLSDEEEGEEPPT